MNKKWDQIFDTLKDIKEHFDELECKFECRKPEQECNKEFTVIKLKLIEHENILKELRGVIKEKKK